MALAVLAAALAGLATALAVPGRPALAAPTAGPGPGDDQGVMLRWRPVLALLAGVGGATFAPGPLTGPVALCASVAVWILVTRAEPPASRRRRAAVARDLPHVVDLYAAALAAGASPGPALALVVDALPGPAADDLRPVHDRLALGMPPSEVWADLARHPALGPLGRTMGRAQASGAPVVVAVRHLADDLAARARAETEDRARTVGVRAALPLGLCLLPAFLLLGIVPLVAAAVSGLGF